MTANPAMPRVLGNVGEASRKAVFGAFRHHFTDTLDSPKRRAALIERYRMTCLDPVERMQLIKSLIAYDDAKREIGADFLPPVHRWSLSALFVHEGRVLRNIRKIAAMLKPEVADA